MTDDPSLPQTPTHQSRTKQSPTQQSPTQQSPTLQSPTQQVTSHPAPAQAGKTYDNTEDGVDPTELADDDLLREVTRLHETRNTTFLHGSDDALEEHTSRTEVLEAEYLRRHPKRDVDPERTRSGARRRDDETPSPQLH